MKADCKRRIAPILLQRINEVPVVALTGPRQVGKTTLALDFAAAVSAVYLDLESEADRAKLSEPELFLKERLGRLVVLDEVQRVPGLFPVLRGLIDRGRREGHRSGLYLVLGSASLELLRQSGETLAGRISHLELTPFTVLEVDDVASTDRLWARGGFPDSYLARSDEVSVRWREDFIRTYLERVIPQLGPRVAVETLRRFWDAGAQSRRVAQRFAAGAERWYRRENRGRLCRSAGRSAAHTTAPTVARERW